MNYFGAVSTDIGIVKQTNQDSACLKIAEFDGKGQAAMMVICDGMGGLAKGELASATVIKRCAQWFEKELPQKINDYSWEKLSEEWKRMIKEQNQKILEYGKTIGVNLGTTLSAFIVIENNYMIVQVGDSRVYEVSDTVSQLTEDQTFIRREINAGRMTPEEAAVHPKRNMLLQCVGASRDVEPVITFGAVVPNTVYMACSDGFRHVLQDNEMLDKFNPLNLNSIETMKQNGDYLIDVVKKRNERDNITVALLKSIM